MTLAFKFSATDRTDVTLVRPEACRFCGDLLHLLAKATSSRIDPSRHYSCIRNSISGMVAYCVSGNTLLAQMNNPNTSHCHILLHRESVLPEVWWLFVCGKHHWKARRWLLYFLTFPAHPDSGNPCSCGIKTPHLPITVVALAVAFARLCAHRPFHRCSPQFLWTHTIRSLSWLSNLSFWHTWHCGNLLHRYARIHHD